MKEFFLSRSLFSYILLSLYACRSECNSMNVFKDVWSVINICTTDYIETVKSQTKDTFFRILPNIFHSVRLPSGTLN